MIGFHQLFAGRTDVVGLDKGQSRRVDDDYWNDAYGLHVVDGEAIGVYPLREDGTARWGCIDIDMEDRSLTQAVADELTQLGVYPHVEISRSKGYHVWWFYPEFIPGWIIRSIGLQVTNLLDVELEVNPKQFWLAEGKVGNYVRLPYPARHKETRRQMFIRDGEVLSLPAFLNSVRYSHAEGSRLVAINLPTCPPEYVLGVKLNPFPSQWPSKGPGMASDAARQEAYAIAFRNAPVAVGARDNQLYTTANLMWACGLTEEEAAERMRDVWTRVEQQGGDFYPEALALSKVEAVYRSRGEPRQREGTGTKIIPVSVWPS